MPDTLTNITAPRVPFLDERTGLISREWYRFFLTLFQLTGAGQTDLTVLDLQKGPVQETIPYDALQQATQLATQLGVAQSEIAALQTAVQGLALAPPRVPAKRARYGSFYDTTTQTATTINTAKAITFNTTDLSNGVRIGTTTSQIIVDTEGIYNFQTSIQLDSTVATAEQFYLWFRLNGVDVPNSGSNVRIQGNNAEVFVALNYFFNLKANDYVELMFSVSNLGVQLLAAAATPPVPAIPSIILTVSNNIHGVQ